MVGNGSKVAEDIVIDGVEKRVGVHIVAVAVDPMVLQGEMHSDKNTDLVVVVVVVAVVVVVVGCQVGGQV